MWGELSVKLGCCVLDLGVQFVKIHQTAPFLYRGSMFIKQKVLHTSANTCVQMHTYTHVYAHMPLWNHTRWVF